MVSFIPYLSLQASSPYHGLRSWLCHRVHPRRKHGSLQPGVDILRPEVEAIADRVMDAFRTIKAEQCIMHNDVHIDRRLSGCVLRAQGATEQRAWGVEQGRRHHS